MSSSESAQSGFRGFIKNTHDALLFLEAAIRGIVPRVTRRFSDIEKREGIVSGVVYVFGEEESEIKRWTDGLSWSASRINKNFLIYRERFTPDETRPAIAEHRKEYPSWLVGTLNGADIKPDGLVKKTVCAKVGEYHYHLVSYYNPEDVMQGRLSRPSLMPQFQSLVVRPEILDCAFREPPKIEVGSDGIRRPIPDEDEDEADSTWSLATAPSLTITYPSESFGDPFPSATSVTNSPPRRNSAAVSPRYQPYAVRPRSLTQSAVAASTPFISQSIPIRTRSRSAPAVEPLPLPPIGQSPSVLLPPPAGSMNSSSDLVLDFDPYAVVSVHNPDRYTHPSYSTHQFDMIVDDKSLFAMQHPTMIRQSDGMLVWSYPGVQGI